MRVAAQKLLERGARLLRVVEVVLINLANGEQCVEAVLAAWVFTAQKAVLRNRLFQNFVVFKAPSHFHQRLGDGNHAGIGLRRSGRPVINATVSVKNLLIITAGSVGDGTPVERLAHPLGRGTTGARPGFIVAGAGMSRQSGKS